MIITLLIHLRSLTMILLALAIGLTTQHALDLPIPGSIIGMLVLFASMVSGIVPASWVKPVASLFIRYMILLFIPISTGLMDHYPLLLANAFPILASTIGGTAIVLVLLALMLERLLAGRK